MSRTEGTCVSMVYEAMETWYGKTYLCVSELDKSRLILHNLIPLVLTILE